MKQIFIRISLIVFSGILLASCFSPDSVTRNIRVIAKAEVNGKMVEGSAVMSIRWQAGGQGRMYARSDVEAVILELGSKKTVYITHTYLSDEGQTSTGYWPQYVAASLGIKRTVRVEDFPIISSANGKFTVSSKTSKTKSLPVFVSFGDEKRKETMFQVTPSNFSKSFGNNVIFKGLWFEFTDDPTTKKIQKRIPVMFNVNESYRKAFPFKDKNGKIIPSRDKKIPGKIHHTSFKHRSRKW